MKRLMLMIVAFVGLPLVWVLWHCLLKTFAVDWVNTPFWTLPRVGFLVGCVVMAALYVWRGKQFVVLYVFAHEMTHALAGLLFFAKIHQISIRASGGFVRLSKGNLVITLAPYCVPFYLLLAVLLYGILQICLPDLLPFWVWSFLFGMAVIFHLCFTADALLSVSQPDTHEYGRFFSWWFILVANLFFALWAVTVTSPNYTLRSQTHQVVLATRTAYSHVYTLANRLVVQGKTLFQKTQHQQRERSL